MRALGGNATIAPPPSPCPAAFASTQYLLPELKRLPEPSVRIEEIRQSLLKQHMLGERGGWLAATALG